MTSAQTVFLDISLTLNSKLVETVVSQFSARSENGRYKALVLLSNGNGLTQTETRNLANMLYRNNLVDLVLPVMIDSACTERSDSDNCPNLINLARWASPDSGKPFFGETKMIFYSELT